MATPPNKKTATNKSIDVESAGFFLLRTPLLPFDDFQRWSESLSSSGVWERGADAASVREAWQSDVQLLRSRLREIVDRPEILHALFVASPSLESALGYWKCEPDSKKGLQAERSLVRYFARMCGRPTPFGLFSGCSIGQVAAEGDPTATEIALAPRDQYRSSSRLDFDYLFAVTDGLRRDAALARELKYWPNSSLRELGDVWHYVESRVVGAGRSHHLVKLYSDQYLCAAIDCARDGATVAELTEAILRVGDDAEIKAEEVLQYVQEIIDSEVLVSSLTPLLTGRPALDDIVAQLVALPSGQAAAEMLGGVRDHLAQLDTKGPGVLPAEFRALAAKLEPLPARADLARLFQVDLIKPMESAVLGQTLLAELTSTIELLCRLGRGSEPGELRTFREAFQARYGRAWVPLLQALDEDTGVGFGSTGIDTSPLLRGLKIVDVQGPSAKISENVETLIRSKLLGNKLEGRAELVLDSSDLPRDESEKSVLANCFDFMFTVAAPSMQAVQNGDFRLCYRGSAGPPAARLLGRFCYADPELERYVRELFRAEGAHDPEAVYAEIVYLPEGRIGNVLCRPVLRDYEITYLGRSGAELDRQVPVSDLLVTVAGDGSILLYSQRLGRRVIPRMANAHGFSNPALASVYRLLCYLQHERGVTAVPGFHWGALNGMNYLPRVRAGRVVLSTERWKLTPEELKVVDKPGRYESWVAVQELRRKLGLPRWIVLSESDNELPVDLDNPLCVDAFVHVLKRLQDAELKELYPPPEELCVAGPEGRFRHELLVPFMRQPSTESREKRSSRRAVRSALALAKIPVSSGRTLPPGSEWLYVKVYGGPAAIEDVLTRAVPPLLQSAFEKGMISRWFFLRYADPQQHLRIRFQCLADRFGQELWLLISSTFQPLLVSGKIWKLQFDTYEREVERYGGMEATVLAEEIFCADSEAVLGVLRTTDGDEGLDSRWRISLLGVDRLLGDCGLDLPAKLATMDRLREAFHREFHVGPALKRQLGDRFRKDRRTIAALLDDAQGHASEIDAARQFLTARSVRVAEAVGQLRRLEEVSKLSVPVAELAETYAHMHINRMIRSSQRAHELVIYDYLFRIYESQMARVGKMGLLADNFEAASE